MFNQLAADCARFAMPGRLQPRQGEGGLCFLDIQADGGDASVCLHGAHVTHFQPRGAAAPLLWVSGRTPWQAGLPIRGGIPVCWPWFAVHPDDPTLPLHGFARTSPWQLVDASCSAGVVELSLQLAAPADVCPGWPHAASLRLSIQVGETLTLELTSVNTGPTVMPLSQALHAYLNVADAGAVRLHGLEGCDYLDKNDAMRRKQQQGPVLPADAIDRIYVDTRAACRVDDPGLQRSIRVEKWGSASTVVWTPWRERASRMPDLDPAAWSRVFCVEVANAGPDAVLLQPGERHKLGVRYAIQAL